MQKIQTLACLLPFLSLCNIAVAHPKQPPFVSGMPRMISWSNADLSNEVNMPLKFRAKVRPLTLNLGPGHPNCMEIDVVFANAAVNLLYVISDRADLFRPVFDESGDLKPNCVIQAGAYDFEHDGNPEIVIAAKDEHGTLYVSIVRYTPAQRASQAINLENWHQVGGFIGHGNAAIHGETLSISQGTQQLATVYTWHNRQFVPTNVSSPLEALPR